MMKHKNNLCRKVTTFVPLHEKKKSIVVRIEIVYFELHCK